MSNGDPVRGADGRFVGHSYESVYAEIKRLDQLRIADQDAIRLALTEEGDTNEALRRESKMYWDSHAREHLVHEQSHAREHGFSQKAIDTAAELARENKSEANEWRAAMSDKDRTFITRQEGTARDIRIDALEKIEVRRSEREATDRESRARQQWVLGVAVTVVSVGLTLLIRLFESGAVARP